jgi:hypothetical protein
MSKNIRDIKNILVIDFETYYDDTYTLKKLINTLYILDPRFEVIMASVIYNDEPPKILTGQQEVYDYLNKVDLKDTIVVSHTKFDLAIIKLIFDLEIPYTSDTQALSRVYGLYALTGKQSTALKAIGDVLVEKRKTKCGKGDAVVDMKGKRLRDLSGEEHLAYADYCKQDTVLSKIVYDSIASKIPQELAYINMTNQMYLQHNFSLDDALLTSYINELQDNRTKTTGLLWESLPRNEKVTELILGKLKAEKRLDKYKASLLPEGGNIADLLSEQDRLTAILAIINSKEVFDGLILPSIKAYCDIHDYTIPYKIPKVNIPEKPKTKNERLLKDWEIKTSRALEKLESGVPDFTKKTGFLLDLMEEETFTDTVDRFTQLLLDFRFYGLKGLAYTRASKFLALAHSTEQSQLTVALAHGGANTLRYSGEEVNLQNLPARGDLTLKRAIVAPPNKILLACDSAQIEARVIPWLCKHDHALNLFRENRDLYCDTAAAIFGTSYEDVFYRAKVEPDAHGVFMRQVGKVTALSAQYGTGAKKFAALLTSSQVVLPDNLSPEHIIRAYRTANKPIVDMWYYLSNYVIPEWLNGGIVELLGTNGQAVRFDGQRKILGERVHTIWLAEDTPIVYPKLRFEKIEQFGRLDYVPVYSRKKGAASNVITTKLWGGLILQNITQAYAFTSIMRKQMLNIRERGFDVALNVHDEVVVSVEEARVEPAITCIVEEMSRSPIWCPDLPLACELEIGYNLADMVTVYKDGAYLCKGLG